MKRLPLIVFAVVGALITLPTVALADQGNPTLSFFSGGGGAHADWLATADHPPGDSDNQAIRLLTTTDPNGYAGILFHHLSGIPVELFPDSSFWSKTPYNPGATLGSPRLVVAFQNAAGQPDGYADLRENVRGTDWEFVSDQATYPNSAWDVMGHPCAPTFYNVTWKQVQACFAGDTTRVVYLTTDPYGVYHLIDDITVNNKTFSSASDNGGDGSNDPAGPAASDVSLLPPLDLPL